MMGSVGRCPNDERRVGVRASNDIRIGGSDGESRHMDDEIFATSSATATNAYRRTRTWTASCPEFDVRNGIVRNPVARARSVGGDAHEFPLERNLQKKGTSSSRPLASPAC